MNKNFVKICREVKGSALLVAILIMGVLIAISLALSVLVFREVRITKDVIDAGRAYFSAESGVEEGLFYLNNELPGWHTDNQIGKIDDNAAYEFKVKNTCNSYPCFDEEEYRTEDVPLEAFYGILGLNETITIPLFTVENGEIRSVKDFSVQFFVPFNPQTDLVFSSAYGWDVLRWKIFGMKNTPAGLITESIGDLAQVASGQNRVTLEDIFANVATPSWFGTVDCDDANLPRGSGVNAIKCASYALPTANSGKEANKICRNTQARDFWGYVNGELTTIYDCYDLSTFMSGHQTGVDGALGLNYLNLTNMMNPAVLSEDVFPTLEDRKKASRMYFRVETFDRETVREYADITAYGYSGGATQSLNVLIRRGGYMPVFNFSLYSTYKDDVGGEGDEYWGETNAEGF